MSSTKRATNWYFGMKAHVDADSGVTHSLETSPPPKRGSTTVRSGDDLLQWRRTLPSWADKGYVSSEREAAFKGTGQGSWGVMRKAPKGGKARRHRREDPCG